MVDEKDRSEQRNVEAEERIELKELKLALGILDGVARYSNQVISGWYFCEGKYSDFEKCTRLIMDARKHNARIATRTRAIWKHLNSKRGGGKGEDVITSLERKTLIITLSITTHLKVVTQGIEYARSMTPKDKIQGMEHYSPSNRNPITAVSIHRLHDVVIPDLRNIIEAVEDLISMERYEQRAMEEAAKDEKK